MDLVFDARGNETNDQRPDMTIYASIYIAMIKKVPAFSVSMPHPNHVNYI